jgi:hypothetical protein
VQPTVQRASWRRKLPHLWSLVRNRNRPEVGREEAIDRGQEALRPPDLRGLPASVRDFDTLGGRGHRWHGGLVELECCERDALGEATTLLTGYGSRLDLDFNLILGEPP